MNILTGEHPLVPWRVQIVGLCMVMMWSRSSRRREEQYGKAHPVIEKPLSHLGPAGIAGWRPRFAPSPQV